MNSLRRQDPATVFGLVTLASIVVLATLALLAPPDGNERARLLQFIGRFHPLTVHLPIALLIFVPILEIAGRSRKFPYLLPACSFVLAVGTIGAIFAAALGWCLARSGGYKGPLITQHMWAALLTAAGMWLSWKLRLGAEPSHGSKAYFATLGVTIAIVSFAGYRGGQLSLGEAHLTEFMPETFASLLGVSNGIEPPANSPNGGPGTFYGARVQPIFTQHCISCHGRSKHKSNLRLDSFEAAMHGGRHGAVIKPNDAKSSDLLRRVALPSSDHDFMPPERAPLAARDISLIEQWIASGASGTLALDAIHETIPVAVAEVTFEDVDPAVVAKQRAGIASTLAQLQQRMPNVLDYQSRSSADIVVNAAWMQSHFGDAELAALSPLAGNIVSADFSGTSITDRSANAIAAMQHLRVLRLGHTHITDAAVRSFASLNELTSLTLFDTPVTAASLNVLARLPRLQHIYISDTRIPKDQQFPPELASKLTF